MNDTLKTNNSQKYEPLIKTIIKTPGLLSLKFVVLNKEYLFNSRHNYLKDILKMKKKNIFGIKMKYVLSKKILSWL